MNKLRAIGPVGRLLGAGDVFVGVGALGVLSTLGAARLSALVSPSVAKSEYFLSLVRRLRSRTAVAVTVMPAGEPIMDALAEPVGALLEFKPDWIVAIGGGSVIDAAKLAWAFYEHPVVTPTSYERPFSLPALRSKCRFAVVPATNGPGSEASSSAVFQTSVGARKSFLVSHELLPDVVVIDPKIAIGLPAANIASSGMDALAHAVEGYLSRHANPLSDGLAVAAASTMFRCLREGVHRPADLETRAKLMGAAYHAGCVQNVALPGIGHAVAHQLASVGVPHARATGSLIANAVQWSSKCNSGSSRATDLANALGVGSVDALLRELRRLCADLDMTPSTMRVDWSTLINDQAFVEGVASDPCARASVRHVDADAVRDFILELRL